MFKPGNNKIVENRGGKANETLKNLSKSKNLKNINFEILTYINIGAIEEPIFLTFNTRIIFDYLK